MCKASFGPDPEFGTRLAARKEMLSWAVAFLLIAIFAAIFGFAAAKPLGIIAFAIFFALFLWALIKDRAGRRR